MRFGRRGSCRRHGLTILTAPTVSGDQIVDETLFATNGTYSPSPDSISNYWFLDGVQLDTELLDNLLIVDTYEGHTITYGEIAHKAGYADSPLNMAA